MTRCGQDADADADAEASPDELCMREGMRHEGEMSRPCMEVASGRCSETVQDGEKHGIICGYM
jgi:hypothetical protein